MRKVLIIGLLFFCSVSWAQNYFIKDSQNRQVYFDKQFVKWVNFFESRYVQLIPNGPLVDIFGGNASLPYVSGFGVDQIFDLSPLSDNRWNKNAYIGNGFGLPEYYDFPYISEIYFDTGNPFHWKIKDFHYRYYEEQADALTNIGFAKLTYDAFGYGLKTTSNGTKLYDTSTKVYGVWEFQIIKNNELSNFQHTFISSTTDGFASTLCNGYYFQVRGDESITFIKSRANLSDPILFETSPAMIDIGTSYMIKITRNSIIDEFVVGAIGTFAIYIKGGTYGDTYTLLIPSISGTNPTLDNQHTVSTYITHDFDSNDRIREYFINANQQNFNNYAQLTGSFEIDNLRSSDELLLYTSEQIGTILANIKNYIGLISGTNYYKNETQP